VIAIPLKDLTGQKFGRLTVLKRTDDHISKSGIRSVKWECICDCGNIVNVIGDALKSGNTKSCGCYKKELDPAIYGKQNKKYNTYDLSGEYGIGYSEDGDAFYFDLDDYEKIKDYYWTKKGMDRHYKSTINKQTVLLHRYILNIHNTNLIVDHINTHHPEDNRKANLRIVTGSENQMNRKLGKNNTSGVTGVSWLKKNNVWRARININNKEINLGYFENFSDAVQARINAEEKYFGEHSYNNSIKQWEENCIDLS
jgi:hypothetical protein